jgi:glycosyltransferase involved in cell wall biosynthesis
MTFGDRLGGCEEFLRTFLAHVNRDRVEPFVVFHAAGSLERGIAAMGVPTAVVETGRLRAPLEGWRALRELRRLLVAQDPHLIVSWYTRAHLYTAPAALLAGMGRRLVWFQHTLPGGTDLDRVATMLPARAIGAPSTAGAAAQRQIRPRRPTFVVLPGIEDPDPSAPEALSELRARLAIPEDRTIIGVVGRLLPWKQQHLVVRCVEELRRRGHNAHALVVGGDAYDVAPGYERELRAMVGARGMGEHATFTGHVDDAIPYIELMDVLVNASTHEPFGIVLLEALALRTPAVAFDADGGPPEILEGGRCGLLARAGDLQHLTRQVERMLEDHGLRAELAERGRERFERMFSAQTMTDALEARLITLAREAADDAQNARPAGSASA